MSTENTEGENAFQEQIREALNTRLRAMLESDSIIQGAMAHRENEFRLVEAYEDEFENALEEGYDLDVELDDGEVVTLGEAEIESIQDNGLYEQFLDSLDSLESFTQFLEDTRDGGE